MNDQPEGHLLLTPGSVNRKPVVNVQPGAHLFLASKGVFKFLSPTPGQTDTMILPAIKQTIQSLAADIQGVVAA